MRPRLLLPLGALLALGVLPAVASADETVNIAANTVQFTPPTVTIQAGQQVTWNFAGGGFIGHNIVLLGKDAPFPSGDVPSDGPVDFTAPAAGATFTHAFGEAGTFRYLCSLHDPGMEGTIIVQPGGGPPPPPPPPPPPATLPPEPIAFASSRATAGKSEIFTIAGSEANPVRLTNAAAADDSEPAWSYDAAHREIAFQSNRDGNLDIFTMNADGSKQVNVTPNSPASDVDPSWSPDSSKIAFSSNRTGDGDIYVMDFDGGNVRRLTSDAGPDLHPTWSPDGKRIAFSSTRTGTSAIFTMDVDPNSTGEGTNLKQMNPLFPAKQLTPEWSPVDANKIVYTQFRGGGPDPDPIVFDLAAGAISGFLTGSGADDLDPTWSPDGTRVIWTRDLPGAGRDLFIRKADGSGEEQPVTNVSDNLSFANPAWQPAARPAKPRPVPPPAPKPPEVPDTRPDPGTAPVPPAFLGLDAPHRTTLKAFRTLGMTVSARCVGLTKGTVKLTVGRKLARRLGLKGTTLASASARCGAGKRVTVLLKPDKKVRKALGAKAARRRGGLKTTLTVVLAGAQKKLSAKLSVLIRS